MLVKVTVVKDDKERKYSLSIDELCHMLIDWNPLQGPLYVTF
ncbi:MAG: hypothetical protein M0Z71_03960 [Nitrospiraceae bacterium]|nr:hypothetical protein [Nitrospiraceae bacterium]